MSPASILHGIAGAPAVDGATDHEGRCAICALVSTRTMPFDRWQGNNFTDQAKIKTWGATLVCETCMWAHSWVPPPGFPDQGDAKKGVNLRLYSHLWGEQTGYRYANKASKPLIRDWIRDRAESRIERCFCAIADSGQKHVVPWTRVNLPGRSRLVVRFEEMDVTIGDWRLIDDLTALLTDGVTKDEIQGADYRVMSWQQSRGLIEPFEAEFGPLRASGWWTLALWLSQRNEEESNERRTARAVAKTDRAAGARNPGGVPRSTPAKPAHALGPDQGSDHGEREDKRKRQRVDHVPVPKAVPARERQASLFDD